MASGTESAQGTAQRDGARDAKGRFQPGRSGNPAGRQRGSRNRATLLRERLNAVQESAVINKAFDNLLNAVGDGRLGASMVLLDALAPKARGRAIDLELPDDALPEDILDKAMWDMARGVITVDEALGIARYVKERLALQQQEYVSRRARARLAAREAEEAAMAAADLARETVSGDTNASAPAATEPVAEAATGGPGAASAAEPTVEEVTAEAIRVFAAARALAAARGEDPGAGGPSDPADALQIQVQAELAALMKRREARPGAGPGRRRAGAGLPEAA